MYHTGVTALEAGRGRRYELDDVLTTPAPPELLELPAALAAEGVWAGAAAAAAEAAAAAAAAEAPADWRLPEAGCRYGCSARERTSYRSSLRYCRQQRMNAWR